MKFQSLLLLGSPFVPAALGWGAAGHEIVATIAQIHLYPSVLPKICEILNFTSTHPDEPQCHLAPIATWADKFKYRMRWSAALHYVGALDDHPSQTCVFPGERGWAGRNLINVLGGVRNTTGLLEEFMDGASDLNTANEALKFLVHFLGDLHMPLHLTGRDRGGNSVKVLFDGRQSNLHSVWDGLLIAKNLRSIPYNYTKPLPVNQIEYNLRGAIYDPFIRRVMWEGIYGTWRDEIPSWLSCPSSDEVSLTSSSSAFSSTSWYSVYSIWRLLKSGFSTSGIEQITDDDVVCPFHWAKPIHQLNCDLVWPEELDKPPYSNSRILSDSADATGRRPSGNYLELDTPEYAGVIAEQRILERLMAQAGIRLAGVLNYLFAEEAEAARSQRLTVAF